MNKYIHQMWFQGEDRCPNKYQKWQNTWRSVHPDFKYLFWDESKICTLLSNEFPEYLDEWLSLDKLIKKCDVARYFILYKYGGVYADMDTISRKHIQGLIDQLNLSSYDVILSEESHDPKAWKSLPAKTLSKMRKYKHVVGNAILISKPGAKFWMDFIKRSFHFKHRNVLESFSTWHLTEFIEQNPLKYPIAVVPSKYLLEKRIDVEYAGHFYDATWFNYTKSEPWLG